MNAAETKRFYHEDCGNEFEICLEPKAKQSPIDATAKVTACPFCAGELSEEDDEV